jgi:hypothetical protein
VFDRYLRDVGIQPFLLPDARYLPGAVVDRKGNFLQNLGKGTSNRVFGQNAVTVTDHVDAKAKLSEATIAQRSSASLTLGIAGVPLDLSGMLAHSKSIQIQIGKLWAQYLALNDADGEQTVIEPADYIGLLNNPKIRKALADQGWLATMKRYVGTGKRPYDICARLIFAESIQFSFAARTGASAKLDAAIVEALDLGGGLDEFARVGEHTVVWQEAKRVPLGFSPVRYKYRRKDARFSWDHKGL